MSVMLVFVFACLGVRLRAVHTSHTAFHSSCGLCFAFQSNAAAVERKTTPIPVCVCNNRIVCTVCSVPYPTIMQWTSVTIKTTPEIFCLFPSRCLLDFVHDPVPQR